jgi:serine/threonine-protein kinase
MAPEQAAGQVTAVGPPADVYALGAILYRVLTGRPPFKAVTRIETLDQVRHAEPVSPTYLRREIPRDLEAICLKCLAKRPAQRYISAEVLAQDLGRWLSGEPTLARPPRWYARAWRRLPRRVLVAALLLLCGPAALLLYTWLTAPDPARVAEEIEARLGRGESVTLIGETGGPAWLRWRTAEHATQISQAGDGAFSLHSWGRATLELVRDPQVDRYVMRAEVRHAKGDDMGEVGLFCCLRSYPLGDDVLHSFLRLAYDDVKDLAKQVSRDQRELKERLPAIKLPPLPKGNEVKLGGRLYAEGKPLPLWDDPAGGLQPQLFQPAGLNGGPWRPLSLEVTPEGIRGTWGATKVIIGPVSMKGLEEATQIALNRMMTSKKARAQFLREITPTFSPRAPLGLYVNQGVASFRRVVIEPIVANGRNP